MSDASSPPFISVVVALYNEEDNLAWSIPPLFDQTYPQDRFEILLVDDGSEDRSAKLCRSFVQEREGRIPRLRYVPVEHGGLSRARNAGIAESQGEIIAFIDADAAAESSWLEELACAFQDPRVGVVGGRIAPLNKESWIANLLATIHYERMAVIGANMAYRRSLLDRIGGFCPVFTYRGDEADLVRRVRRETDFRVVHCDAASVDHLLPPTCRQWLRERWTAGKLWPLRRQVDLAWGGAESLPSLVLSALRRLADLLFVPLLLAFAWTGHPAPAIGLIATAPLFIRRYLLPGALRREVYASLRARYGRSRAFVLLPYALGLLYVGALADHLAFFAHAIRRWPDPYSGDVPFPSRSRPTQS